MRIDSVGSSSGWRRSCRPAHNSIPPDGGLNLWIELPPGVAATDMYFRAARHGVAFAAGDAFFADKPNRRTLRLSFGRIDEDRIDEGLDRFVQVVEDLCRAAERPAAWFV